jgi:amino acid adenylation domain-containing protein
MTQQSLHSDERALLAQLLQQKKQSYSYPLSYGQQALWFIYQNAPASPAYNMAWPFELQGNLNLTALQQALQAIVNRHPALRTAIQLEDGELMQTVQPTGAYHWEEHQAVEWSEQQLWSAMKTAYEQPFDLTQGPVLRAYLFQAAPQRYILLLTLHHLLGDASSMAILANELLTLYQAELSGQKVALPSILASYADFVRAETAMLNSPTGDELAQYWQHRLGDESPILNLPTDYSRPAIQSYNGASVPFCLPAKLSEQIKQLAQQEKSSRFSLLLTAFQTLLHRYTGQTEIWIGTPTSSSRQPQFANLIGYLVNSVVLRASIDPNLSFSDLLSETKQTVLEAIEHSAYPFPLLVKNLQPQRDLSYAPLFQVMLDFQSADSLPIKQNIGGLIVSVLELPQMEGQFDLTLSLSEGECLSGAFRYNCDLFKQETIERMAAHFQTMLTSIVTNPVQSIGHLSMLTETEVQQLRAWNDTATDYPHDKTIVDIFEEQVEKTPESVAVVFEGQQLSYQLLNRKANQLAHYLQSLGVKPEVQVGICVERSFEMVIGLLGILKAGGAYVPLDPAYPAARLAFMLEEAQVPVLLTQLNLKENFAETTASVVCLDAEEEDMSRLSGENLISGVVPTNLAYVIYTSGSTGQPKGVMIDHRGVVNTIKDINQRFGVGPQDRVLALSALSFDLSVYDIFGILATGGTVVMPNADLAKDPAHWVELMIQHNVTVWNTVPALMLLLVDYVSERPKMVPNDLRLSMMSGDWIPLNLPERIKALWPQAQVISLGGATEASIWSIYYPIETVDPTWKSIPYGKPLLNQTFHVLTESMEPCPIWVPGQLYIGGIGLAQGYWRDEEKTKASFIIHPQTQERLYKTGDLGRYLPDGNIEFLGRIDNQIKIRGFRIELGEIEAVLSQHPSVKDAVVTVFDSDDNKRLVTYLTTVSEQNVAELKEWLKARLPDYMIPSNFTILDHLPLTPNGKIDRKALPKIDTVIRKSDYVYPRDAVELRLVQIWEKFLHISQVSVQDNFFEIGGDSLLAIRMISNIEQEFGIKIPIHILFQEGTVEKLACILRQGFVPSSTLLPLVCLQPQGSKSPLFVVHAAGSSGVDYFHMAMLMGTERPFYAFHPKGFDPGDSFPASVEEIAADYVAAVCKVQSKGPYILAGWSFGGTVAFEMARILERAGETVPFLIMIDAPSPFVVFDEKDDIEFLLDRVPFFDSRFSLEVLDLPSSREAQLAYLFKEMKLAGIFRPDIDEAYAQRWLSLYKHHNSLCGSYRPSSPFNGKIIFFKPSEKIPFDVQMGHPIPGWERLARKGIEVHETRGNHFNMVSSANTPVLVEKMKECIDSSGVDSRSH